MHAVCMLYLGASKQRTKIQAAPGRVSPILAALAQKCGASSSYLVSPCSPAAPPVESLRCEGLHHIKSPVCCHPLDLLCHLQVQTQMGFLMRKTPACTCMSSCTISGCYMQTHVSCWCEAVSLTESNATSIPTHSAWKSACIQIACSQWARWCCVAVNETGHTIEYADNSCVMGGWEGSTMSRCPNTPHAWQLGWLPVYQVGFLSVANTETSWTSGSSPAVVAYYMTTPSPFLWASSLNPTNRASCVLTLQITGAELPAGRTVTIPLEPQSSPTSLGVRIIPDWASGAKPLYLGFREAAGKCCSSPSTRQVEQLVGARG